MALTTRDALTSRTLEYDSADRLVKVTPATGSAASFDFGGRGRAGAPEQALLTDCTKKRGDVHAWRFGGSQPMGTMTVLVNRSERHFQLWAYAVGHSQLLLRSNKSGTSATRIDVLFKGVEAMNLTRSLDGLVVDEVDVDQAVAIAAAAGVELFEGAKVFAVQSRLHRGFVIALACVEAEDEGMYFDPSPMWRGSKASG